MDFKVTVKDFSLEQTVTCGQCFHFCRVDENEFIIVHLDKMLHVKQINDELTLFDCSSDEYNKIWKHYFDLDRDYSEIKNILINRDATLIPVIEEGQGIRLLNQDYFETLISFIISQNNQIPRIKQLVAAFSKTYGKKVGEYDGVSYYSFPEAEVLARATEQELRDIKVGFRANYIIAAANAFINGDISLETLKNMSYSEKKKALTAVKGIGEKVANCIILYSLNERNAFPVDVWIKRIMENIYFGGEDTDKSIISAYADKMYGDLGGYAQQYLFYYGRNIKKMKNNEK